MIKKYLKTLLILFAICLVGAVVFYFSYGWKDEQVQASLNFSEQSLAILNPNSHPQAGDNWTVSFETKGTADLTITPDDQVSIDDLDFVSLKCGEEERTPQILANDVIFYPDWACDGTGEVTHLVNVARKHTLNFQFGDQTAYAYNGPGLIATLERSPLAYAEEADAFFVDLRSLQIRFRKGAAGYDEIWKDGRPLVEEVRWFLRDSKGKQVGEPYKLEWEVVDGYTLRVTRSYTDYEGTDFTVVQECRSDEGIKTSVKGVAGKSDSFTLVWSASGIALPSVVHEGRRVSCFETDILRPEVAFDYEDVYEQLGDITSVEVSGQAGGRKANFAFNIGGLITGKEFEVDPVTIATSEFTGATSYNSQRKLARTSDGTLYSVYQKKLGSYYQIYVKKSVNDGDTWTDETRISTYSGMDSNDQYPPSIAVDSSDHLHVVWHGKATSYTRYQIWHAKYATSWQTPVRISTYSGMNTNHQYYPSIAVDSQDHLHVVWYGPATGYSITDAQIWYAKYATSWQTPVRISTYSGMNSYYQFYPSIAVDSSDHFHVVWHGWATGFTDTVQIWYAKYTTSWQTPVRISTYSGMATREQADASIAVDGSDHLHVVWRGTGTGYTTASQIWYRKFTTSWQTPVRISTYSGMDTNHQYYPSIAVDSQDHLHVVWQGMATGYTSYNVIWYAKYTTSWQAPTCIQSAAQSKYPNLRWSYYCCNGGYLDYLWTEGAASSYDINFDKDTSVTMPGGPESTSTSATAYSFQRKTWYDGKRHWIAFHSLADTRIEFWYSTDNRSSWTENDSARISVNTNDFTIEADSSNAFIAYTGGTGGYDIEARSATTYPGTGFAWSAATTVYDGDSDTNKYSYPAMTKDSKDSNNKIWITAVHLSSTNYIFKGIQSTNANDISAWQTASTLDTSGNSNKYGTIVPSGTGEVYAVWIDDDAIEGKEYTGSWAESPTPIATGVTGLSNNMSAVGDSSGNVHLTYIDSSGYVQYQEYTTTWQDAVTLDSNAGNEYPTISIDIVGSNGLYAFWIRGDHIYYRRSCSPYTSWVSAETLEDEGTNDWTTAGYQDFDSGKIFVEWTETTSSPYDIKWKSITPTACNQPPTAPTSLGPSSYVDGSWGNDNTPTLEFTQSDPDAGNTVKYRIQIDDSADFGSLIVDYTSALLSQGATSFTVGQAAGSGSYTVGSEGQTLVDSSNYYWRVMSEDNNRATSFWSTANAGAIAFKIDTTPPANVGIFSIEADSTSQLTITALTATDSLSGLASNPYFFRETSGNPGGSSSVDWQSSPIFVDDGLSPGTQYCYQVKVKDNVGNESDYSTISGQTTLSAGVPLVLPPISTTGLGNISESLGGQVSKTFESGRLAKVVFPPQSIKGTVVVKIEPQDKVEIIKNNPLPKNTQIVGDLVADFKALFGGKELEKFERVIPITFTYSDKQIKEAGVNEKTLKIYWWDKTTKSWKPLKSEVNTLTNTVTAYTIHFTLFAVIGETKELIEEAPTIAYKGIPAGFTFEKNLKYGDKNDDVKYLQIILKTETSETYPADVPATGWFAPITKASVVAFQEKYSDEILTPWELTTGTGFVGSTTRAKLNSLLAVVPTEEKEVTPEILEIPADYKFTTDLKYDQTSDDVRYLQIFLKAQGTEIYPEGIVSGWFGPLTKKAVIRFQEKYAKDILVLWGLTKGTGFVGKTTRAKINEILGR